MELLRVLKVKLLKSLKSETFIGVVKVRLLRVLKVKLFRSLKSETFKGS